MKTIVRGGLLLLLFGILFYPSLVRFGIGFETGIAALSDSDNQVRCAGIDCLRNPGDGNREQVVKSLLIHALKGKQTSGSKEDLYEPARTILKIRGRWFGGKEIGSSRVALNSIAQMGLPGREAVKKLVSDPQVGSISRVVSERWDELETQGVSFQWTEQMQPDIPR